MTFLPIVARELRVASRRRGAWWTRVSAGFIGIGLGAFVMLAETGSPPAILGKEIFTTVSCFLFIYAAVAGALVTCDSLAEEKREGTLGLLFLTDLKGYDVVFGKLAATSVNTIYAIVAVIPLMAIPILLGGVASAEFWRVVVVAVNLLMFSLSVGMLASSLSRSDHRAMFLSFSIIVALVFAPWLLSMYGWGHARRPVEWLVLGSPAVQCFTVFDDPVRNPKEQLAFWTNVGITQVYFWVFIFTACRVVPRSWHETGQRFQSSGVFGMLRELLEGTGDTRGARRKRMLEINPYFWRAARKRTKDILVWVLIVGAALLWLWIWQSGDSFFDASLDVFLLLLVNAGLKWWVTSEAARHLSDDRRSGGLELLLSTPLREQEILQGQRRALLHQFAAPVTVVLLVDFLFVLVSLKHSQPDERTGWLLFYITIGGFLVFDLFALSTVGMWLGLSGRKTNRATIIGLLRIVVLPSAAFAVIGILVPLVASNANPSLTGFAIFWIVLCTVTNLVFMTSANSHLRNFRNIVAQRFTTKFDEVETKPIAAATSKAPAAAAMST